MSSNRDSGYGSGAPGTPRRSSRLSNSYDDYQPTPTTTHRSGSTGRVTSLTARRPSVPSRTMRGRSLSSSISQAAPSNFRAQSRAGRRSRRGTSTIGSSATSRRSTAGSSASRMGGQRRRRRTTTRTRTTTTTRRRNIRSRAGAARSTAGRARAQQGRRRRPARPMGSRTGGRSTMGQRRRTRASTQSRASRQS